MLLKGSFKVHKYKMFRSKIRLRFINIKDSAQKVRLRVRNVKGAVQIVVYGSEI